MHVLNNNALPPLWTTILDWLSEQYTPYSIGNFGLSNHDGKNPELLSQFQEGSS